MSLYSDTVLAESSLLSYWKLDETSGTSAADSKGTNTGTYQGSVTLNQSPTNTFIGGRSITLPGSSSAYVLAKTAALLATLTNASVEAWFKTTVASGTGTAIYCERAASGNAIWKLEVTSAGVIKFTHRNTANTLDQPTAGTGYNNGAWHHVVITKAGTSIKFYVDGVQVGSTATLAGNDTLTDSGMETWIGGDKADSTQAWNGGLDEVAIYNTTLSSSAILAHYNASQLKDTYSDVILAETSLVSYWKLAEGSGTTATDSKGTNTATYNGTFTLGQTSPGKYMKGGVLLDGSTGYAEAPTASNLHPTSALSLEAWVKFTSLPSNYKSIAGCGYSSNSSPYSDYTLGVDNTNRLKVNINIGGTSQGIVHSADPVVGTWYHMVMTYDGTTLKFYLNGTLSSSLAASGTVGNSGQPFEIGRYNRGGSTGENFPGTISNVAVYNLALSAQAVANHYNAANTLIYDGSSSIYNETLVTYDGITPTSARLSQFAIEVLEQYPRAARLSQLAIEVLEQKPRAIRLSQLAIEVLRATSDYVPPPVTILTDIFTSCIIN